MTSFKVKSNILNEDIYCPAEKAVLLASYQVQAKFLEYDDEVHDVGYLANERLLSQSVISQHKLSIEEWEEKVSAFHKQHRGVSREEAMLEYLKIAQDLEMFGINYFAIYNKKGSEMLLGVDALGINVYEKNNKLAPKISFPWSEIKKISHAGEKFKVRLHDKGSIPFEGKTKEPKTAKKIYEMCSGNHEMYVRRRRPDTLEVQQMKEQKREGEKQKTKDRMALKREIEAREKIEKSRQETVTKYKALQDEMERYKSDLDEAKRTIEELERLLRETQVYLIPNWIGSKNN
jgi:radixin